MRLRRQTITAPWIRRKSLGIRRQRYLASSMTTEKPGAVAGRRKAGASRPFRQGAGPLRSEQSRVDDRVMFLKYPRALFTSNTDVTLKPTMNSHHGFRAAIAAVIAILPITAFSQTGILHKRGPVAVNALPANALPATAMGGGVRPDKLEGHLMVDPSGFAGKPGQPPIAADVATLMPTRGDSHVPLLPVPGGPGASKAFEGAAGRPSPLERSAHLPPVGLDRATAVTADQAGGLEHAQRATAMAAGLAESHHGLRHGSQPGVHRISGHAAGVRPNAVAVPMQGSATAQPRALKPVAVQRVGQLPAQSAPRWRERLRFSWPGSGP
jgi:hypothetical protein